MSLAQECGMSFVKEYYNHLATAPDAPALTNMYTKFSQMVTEEGELVTGVDKIADVLSKKALEQRKFRLHGVGCYPSVSESILVLVRGIVLTRESTKQFNQTFLLVPVKASENTFYIYNDVLELTDDVDLSPAAAAPVEAVAAPEYVEPEPEEPEPEVVAEEPVHEEVVEEPVAEPEVEEKPAPATKAPVKEEAPKAVVPAIIRSGWAGILGKKAEPEAAARPQVVSGGAVPGRVAATVKPKEPERARGTSPVRRGPRGSSPQKFPKPSHSIHVRLTGLRKEDINEADIETLFGKFGKIGSKTLNVERGYCFVDFIEKKSMDAALAAAEAQEIVHGGKPLECGEKKAAPKPGAKKVDEKPRGLTNGAAPAAAAARRK